MTLPYNLPILSPLPPGPWTSEPNHLELTINNFSCVIIRHRMGHLCGYVLVPRDHPLFAYAPYLDSDLSIHGGITYNRETREGRWLGFDCAHSGDMVPSRNPPILWDTSGVYRGIPYITSELTSLTKQLFFYQPSPRVRDLWSLNLAIMDIRPTLSNPTLANNLISHISSL